jgi:hypothetical protein
MPVHLSEDKNVKTIELTANVGRDRKIVLQLPDDIPEGDHHVVVMIDEQSFAEAPPDRSLELPLLPVKSWPADLSLRREDMYDEWGR